MKKARFWAISFLLLLFLLSLATLTMLGFTQVETSPNGVHTRLLVPAGGQSSVGIHIYSGTGDTPHLPGFLDGPVVRLDQAGNWAATWFCEDRVLHRRGNDPLLQIECAGQARTFAVKAAVPPQPADIAMPRKLLVLSDIEGNARFLDAALRELGVIDADGNWRYGDGHLVIAGDSVDRGREVFAVLWRLHDLSAAAVAQGGAVHVLLGNHEQYMLLGNTSRAHREHIYTMVRMGGERQVFGADTVLGAWLRAQPVALRAGDVLFTHAGISPEVAAKGATLKQMNIAMNKYWRGMALPGAALDAAIGEGGVTQYRGYVPMEEERFPQASAAQLDQVLKHYGARTMVVGHTPVERITPLYDGRIYAVDVNTDTAASQALLFEDGKPRVLELGTKRELPDERAGRRRRAIDLTSRDDWQMLGRFVQRGWELSRLPYPY